MGLHRRQLLTGLAAAAVLPARAQFRIEVSGVGATQIPVTVAHFRDEDKLKVALSDVVRADLARSGLFKVSDTKAALDERSAVNPAEWRAQGADALVAGSTMRLADGRYDIRFKLWDAVKGGELLGRSNVVAEGDLRLAAHRIADEIHEKLTGEKGVNATRIAYVVRAGRRHTLYVADADGEGRQVALASPDPIISPAWSPDGQELAYVSFFEKQKAVVYVQNLATGQRRALADFKGSNSAPAWSPDGKELAVTLSRGGPAQLHVIARTGGEPRRLTSSSAIDTEPVYSPDGAQVFFVSDRGGGPQVYRVPAAGGNAQRITFGGGYNISPAISPDGKLLSYITRQGNAFKLMVMELDGGAPRALTDTQDDESPSFAPNGRVIIYATRVGGRDVLMTTTIDGKVKARLPFDGADVREPAWGPYVR